MIIFIAKLSIQMVKIWMNDKRFSREKYAKYIMNWYWVFIDFRDDLSQEEFNKILNEYKSELGIEESGIIGCVVFFFRFETSLLCTGKLFLKII